MEMVYGNGRDFTHCETTRHEETTNDPILESRTITLKVSIEIFLISIYNSFPEPLKLNFQVKICKYVHKLNFMGSFHGF